MAKFKCDLCDNWVENITKQFLKKAIWGNKKCIFQTCDDCSKAIVRQAEKFAKEEEQVKLEKTEE